ncbi:MAG: B12-binding domain-containing radical SAM protein [Candidatus Helarchaeota archaeon]
MKILLINPSSKIFDSYIDRTDYYNKKHLFTASMPPMGLLYLDAILDDSGYKTMIIDHSATGISLNSMLKKIKNFDPEIIGISVLSNSSQTSNKIARSIKKLNPNIKIVYGNCHATIWGKRILKNYPFVDYCVKGEGEYTFLKLLDAIERNKSMENIDGLVYRNNGHIVENKDAPLIEKLDKLPFPNREKLNIEYSWDFGGFKFAQGRFSTILSSRGCPFKCIYCMNSLLARHKWRSRSIENIIEELLLLEEMKYKEIFFLDDNFTLKRNRVIEINERIKKEKIDIVFSARGRVDQNSGNMFKSMVEKGNFKYISFGVESGSQKILDYYNKMITPQQAYDTLKLARRAGFDFIMANFMVGAPYESLSDIYQTLKFVLTADISWPVITIVQAVPGTKMWVDLQKIKSLNIDKYWETGVPVIDLNINGYTREILNKLIIETYSRFTSFRRFKFLFNEFLTSLKSSYKLKKVINLLRNLNLLKGIYSEIADGMSA